MVETHYCAVITGDIINSRQGPESIWRDALVEGLSHLGKEPYDWQIFRGDSFQLFCEKPDQAFHSAMQLKACLKSQKGCDLRMAIGFGRCDSRLGRVLESNGPAFVFSGHSFDELESRQVNLSFASEDSQLNADLNASFGLASWIMDRWLPNYAETMQTSLRFPDLTQKALGEILGIAQNTVSERQMRAAKRELLAMDAVYREKINAYLLPKSIIK